LKCLWCGGPHPSAVCPNRGGGGNLANRKRAFGIFLGMMQETLGKEDHDEIIEDADESEDDEVIAFNLEATRGKGILDGGATRSAGGIEQLEPLQQEYINQSGVGLRSSLPLWSLPSRTVNVRRQAPAW